MSMTYGLSGALKEPGALRLRQPEPAELVFGPARFLVGPGGLVLGADLEGVRIFVHFKGDYGRAFAVELLLAAGLAPSFISRAEQQLLDDFSGSSFMRKYCSQSDADGTTVVTIVRKPIAKVVRISWLRQRHTVEICLPLAEFTELERFFEWHYRPGTNNKEKA